MADIDFGSLLSNPLFMGGVQGLLAPAPQRGQAFLQGVQAASQLTNAQQQQKLNALKLQQATNAANFNPQDYMQTAPSPVGTNAALGAAGPALPAQMPAVLGGPIGGQTALPGAAPGQLAIQPTPGTPTGRVDVPGLLTGAMQAGMGPQDAAAISGMLDPATAARVALASKFEKLAPGEMGVNGLGEPIAQNGNAPINDPSAVLQRTMVAAKAARDSGNTALADQLDSAVAKQSGAFEQNMAQQRLQETQNQHETNNDLRKTNQQLVQGQRDYMNNERNQQQATQFANSMEKSGIPQAQQTLDQIKSIVAKYPPGQLPGYGIVEGMKPMWALSQDGQQLRQAVQQLSNINLKARSGAAVTQQEFERFKQELGTSSMVPESRLRQGIDQMQNLVEAQKRNYVAGAPRDTVATYEANGGMPLSYLLPPDKTATTSAAPAGGVAIESATPDDIKAAIARKMGKK